jgi:hypothetical protein
MDSRLPNNGGYRAVMLRTPPFKYTRYDDGGSELCDLALDPNELENQGDWERLNPHRVLIDRLIFGDTDFL